MPSEKNYTKNKINVLGKKMAFVDEGVGDPIVLVHGNPTSSYLWRNVIPHLLEYGRCIAPDLIGMGDSEKLDPSGPESYRFVEHRRYFEAFLDLLDIRKNIFFVVHDWGSALAFDWSRRHREAIKGIAYMEAIVQNLTWQDWPEQGREFFKALRSPEGEEMILEKNLFIENILPAAILRKLSYGEMAEYRRPFLNAGENRRPTLTWPRELPFHGEPKDVANIVRSYRKWLEYAPVPKLFISADPGMILIGPLREYCGTWPYQQEVTVRGLHYIQEDCPDEIGAAVADFIRSLNQQRV